MPRTALPLILGLLASPTGPTDPESPTDPVSRSDAGPWMALHERFLEELRPGTAGLIFIGDSITANWAQAAPGVWDRYYAPRKAVNLGIGGDRTQHVLWRLQHGELRGISPGLAIVMIGTNNIYDNAPEEIAAGITAIVRTIRDRLPRTKILLLGIFPRGARPDDPARLRVAAINDEIKSLDDGRSVTYLDISKSFLDDAGVLTREIAPDGLHLSRRGYRIWAEAIEPTVWALTQPSPTPR